MRGGKRLGAGRSYRPWNRIDLAHRFATLKWEFREAKIPGAARKALLALHAQEHGDKGNPETTRRLIKRGQREDNFLNEVSVKRDNREPLTEYEQKILRKLAWRRRRRRRG